MPVSLSMDSLLYLNITIAAVLAILSYSYYSTKKKSITAESQKNPPEPAGAWPIIGHLPVLARTQPLHQTLGAIADKLGPIFTLRLGMRQDVVISSWELAKEIFSTNDLAVSSRPIIASAEHLGYNFAAFGSAPYGAYWREIRKITTIELLSNRRLGQLKHIRINELKTALKVLYNQLYSEERKNTSSGSVAVELKEWLQELNLNQILRMIAGKRYFGASAVGDEAEARQWQKATEEFFHYLGMVVLRDAVPCLWWMDLGGNEKAMKRTAKELDRIVGKWLEEHKRKRALGEGNKEDRDFIDIMLSVLDGKEIAGYDADTINKATCVTLIVGASDTVVVTTTWALSLLLNNRHVLKKVQEELDICVGRERLVNDADISKLVYLQAVVKETLRLYPAAPLAVHRQAIEDFTISGYHVKKGNWVMVNIWKIHTDPRVWPNPLEFKPERFLTTHKNIDVRGQNFELIPFGSGRRVCPGLSFGLQMVQLTLASLLQAFEISTPGNVAVDMTESVGLTNIKATPLELLLSPRLPVELYA